MKIFIIADTHFGHENVIRFCNRPFRSVDDMDKVLIKNWNAVVAPQDTIIHLGDFMLGRKERCREIIKQLNGKKILIKGNHDHWSDEFYRGAGFSYVSKFPILYNNFFLLSHAPLQLSETTPYFNYYGHIHNDEKYHDTATSKCVSVERTNYQPILILET